MDTRTTSAAGIAGGPLLKVRATSADASLDAAPLRRGWLLTSVMERSLCVLDGPSRRPSRAFRRKRANCRPSADPVAAYPVKTRSPHVRTLAVCPAGLDSVNLAHKVSGAVHLAGGDDLTSYSDADRRREARAYLATHTV